MISTAIFDLETSDLNGDRGIVLCGCVKSSKHRGIITVRSDETNPNWDRGKRANDKETVKRIAAILSDHDVVAAHNGVRFDLPFLRTRLARWGLPRLPDLKVVDPLNLAWRKLRLHRNTLASLQDHLGVSHVKTPLALSKWMEAILDGSRSAMDEIVAHCVADVKVLDAVLDLVKPYVKQLDDRGSGL